MRVVCWGTYDKGKPRTRILHKGIRTAGAHVDEIHSDIWTNVEDKSQVRGTLRRASMAVRWLMAYPLLVGRLLRVTKPDLILVSYPGLIDIFIASLIAKMRGIPIAWDVFISVYDTVCEDRRLINGGSLSGRLLWWLERMALRCPDLIFMDTRAYARRLEALFDLPPEHCEAVWVGVELDCFRARAFPAEREERKMRVLFYGQFIPLHGIPTIIEAARLLRDRPIRWQLVGRGQEVNRVHKMLNEDPLEHVDWIEWIEYSRLEECIAGSDLCLGIFGTSQKAACVIPNKIFQVVAVGRPVITLDSPAIRELLTPSQPCTYLVPGGDAQALANAVVAHQRYLRENSLLGDCHADLHSRINCDAVGRQFLKIVKRRLDVECAI